MSLRTLADHVLDIAQNAINAGANDISLTVEETAVLFRFRVEDNGKGMDEATIQRVFDPFYTTRNRNIRRFGLGLPFLLEASRLTGGDLELSSEKGKGTIISVSFFKSHIDCQPVGELGAVFFSLLSYSPDIRWHIRREYLKTGYDIESDLFQRLLDNPADFFSPIFLGQLKESLEELETSIHEEG